MNRHSAKIITSILVLAVFAQANVLAKDDVPKLKELKGKSLAEKITPLRHKKGLWGYANPEGKFVIRAAFNEAYPYEGKVARVCYEGKWGIINERGLYVMPPLVYDYISEFSADSLAVVKKGSGWGIVNAKAESIQNTTYDEITYADYGYRILKDGKYGTIDHLGSTVFEPQFDELETLDRDRQIEQFKKDGSWGLLKGGSQILSVRIDKPLTLMQKGKDGSVDLYRAFIDDKVGVVTPYGDFVVPCVYDDLYIDGSGRFYIIRQGDKYGVVSTRMVELIPPVLDNPPALTEEIFRLYDDGKFYAVHIDGKIPFEDCAGLYEVFKPEEYVSTRSIPEWAKTSLVEDNILRRNDKIEAARQVVKVLSSNNFDVEWAGIQKDMPKEFDLTIPQDSKGHYGIIHAEAFRLSSGSSSDIGGSVYDVMFAAPALPAGNVELVSDPTTGETFLNICGVLHSVKETFSQMNIKKFNAFYPKEYAMLPDGDIMVRLAFVRPASEVGSPLVETNSFRIPVEPYDIKIHKGASVPSGEDHVVFLFDNERNAAVSCFELSQASKASVFVSRFNGLNLTASGTVIVDEKTPLRRFDMSGNHDWDFVPKTGEQFYGIEETENFIYLSGTTKAGQSGGAVSPLIVQLNKMGERIKDYSLPYGDAVITDIICRNHLLYAKATFRREKIFGPDYYPLMVVDDMGDNFGVSLCCAWEDWDGGVIGGCGLVSEDGSWLVSPVLSDEQMCTSFDWEFGAFSSDHLIVNYRGKYGMIDRKGNMTIDPKYDLIEYLDNPSFVRVRQNGGYGVLDVNGNVIVPAQYDHVGNMSDDIIIVRSNGRYGCYDKDGKMAVPMEYEEIREYADGMARIRLKQRFGFIDKRGNMVVAPFSDEVENFAEGVALVIIKGKYGFVTVDGDWVVVPMYSHGSSFSGGLACMALNDKFGYIDKAGNFVIPMQYDNASSFNPEHGLASVSLDGKWGVISKDGSVVVPIEYDAVTIASDGYVRVKLGDKFGVMAKDGEMICAPECDSIDIDTMGRIFRCGVAEGRKDGQRVRLDLLGNLIYQYSRFTN